MNRGVASGEAPVRHSLRVGGIGSRRAFLPGDGGGASNTGPVTGVHRARDPLARWRRVLRSACSGEGRAWVEFRGDSTTLGGFHGAGANSWANSVPAVVRQRFAAEGCRIDGPGLIRMIATGSDPNFFYGAGEHLTLSGSWTGLGGVSGFASTNAGDQVTFTTQYPARYLTLWLSRSYADNGALFETRVDGGSWVSSGAPPGSATPFRLRSKTLDLGTLGAHTVDVRIVSGYTILYGFTTASGRGGVQVGNAGESGKTAASMPNGLMPYARGIGEVVAVPDLVVVQIGANDWNNLLPVATYKQNLTTQVAGILADGSDLLIRSPFRSSADKIPRLRDFAEAAKQVAAAAGAMYVDTHSRWNTLPDHVFNSYMSDSLHPIPAGYANEAAIVAQILLAPTIDTPITDVVS